MEQTVTIGGRAMRMKASALIPRLYRSRFGRDLIRDMTRLSQACRKAADLPQDATEERRQAAQLSALDLTIFENVAWLMLRHAGEPVPDSPEEWLDSIPGVLDVYEALPAVLALWGGAQATTATPKKK